MIGTAYLNSSYDLLSSRQSQIARVQEQLNNASNEVATGLKSDLYRTLGFASSEVLELRAQFERNDGFISSNQLLAGRLEVTAATLQEIRNTTQDFLFDAISNAQSPTANAQDLQAAALSALEQITSQLNATNQNAALFSGVDSNNLAIQDWNVANPATGLSPSDVLAGVVGAGIGDATDATTKFGVLADIFASTDTVQPLRNFEETFYNGAPALQPGGGETPRLKAQIDKNTTLEFGIQANDPEIRNILQGLAMFASVDVSEISDGTGYEAWVGEAIDVLNAGVTGLTTTEAELGTKQGQLENKISSLQNLSDIYSTRISDLEGVDLYEASTRVLQLETQLSASYTITSRLSQLTFLSFM